jgi:purine-binding chemotaxis protein CheW
MTIPLQLLTFKAQGRWYACDLLWVREILSQPALTPIDRAPAVVRGLIHLRGQILTALDLGRRLGLASGEDAPSHRCIVFKTAPELSRLSTPPADAPLAGQDLLGIIVDTVGDILSCEDAVLPPPTETMSGLDSACIAGVIPRPEGLVTLLSIGAVLSIAPTTSA